MEEETGAKNVYLLIKCEKQCCKERQCCSQDEAGVVLILIKKSVFLKRDCLPRSCGQVWLWEGIQGWN